MRIFASLFLFGIIVSAQAQNANFPIVDTNQKTFYNNVNEIAKPGIENIFYGQDAHYEGNQPKYINNGNETITDQVTGLMWQQKMGEKISFADAFIKADTMTLGGFHDWRVPSIKELYSLIQFSGITGQGTHNSVPYIDTEYFEQPFGDENSGERFIDAQTWSSTEYVGKIMNGNDGIFGVNFIDGRIKGYPKYKPQTGTPNKMYFRMVRGNEDYGKNRFKDNNDGTVSDLATGLMWQKSDNGQTYNWQEALNYAENLVLAGYSDWRLPNAKELQSIVDYNRCPDITNSAAIDSVFVCTEINDPDGNSGHYGFYWTGTTHHDGLQTGKHAVYVAFGEAQGKMNGNLLDVHGAGAQRGDPKTGEREDYPQFFGPQGDVRYVFNFVRCVRNFDEINSNTIKYKKGKLQIFPNPVLNFSKIIVPQKTGKLKIYSGIGTLVKNEIVQTGYYVLDATKLNTGIYVVVFEKEDLIISQKFIKL